MQTLKFTLLIFFCSSLTVLKSQRYQDMLLPQEEKELKSKQIVEASPFIFEGIVENFDSYWDPKKENIYTSVKVHISHVYRGEDLRQGYIQVIITGGQVDGVWQYDKHSGVNLVKNKKYIFFCRQNQLPLPDFEVNFDNEISCSFFFEENYSKITNFQYTEQKSGWAGLFGLKFISIDNVNEYLSKFPKINIPQKKK